MRIRYIMGLMALLATFVFAGCSNNDDNQSGNPQEPTLQYIGLKDKTDLRVADEYVWEKYGIGYNPKLRLIDDYLYVTTAYGLYRKNIETIHNTQWELYAFDGEPVRDFARNGASVLAITCNRNDKALLLSTDDGQTYSKATPDSFTDGCGVYASPGLLAFSQNPQNPNSMLLLAVTPNPELFGLLKSVDFGKTWHSIRPYILGFQNWVARFNPHDTNTLYCAGEEMTFNSVIYCSNNDGQDWNLIESADNNCVHHIAFHPYDPELMIYSGEYYLKKTTDRGKTWRVVLEDDMYFYKTLYDSNNPSILYASGSNRIPSSPNLFTVHRSTNGGDDWSIFFQTNLPGEGSIIDMELYNDKLFLYTYTDGVYMLSIPD